MRRIVLSSVMLIGWFAAGGRLALADESAASPLSSELRAVVSQAAEHPPDPQETLAIARTRLRSSIEQLERFLASGDADNDRRWRQWLQLPRLKGQLEGQEPAVDALHSIHERYYENQPGLELPAFLAVRRELGGYLTSWEYANSDSPRELFRRRLVEFEETMERLDVHPTPADSQRAASIVQWVAPLGEIGAQVASAARDRYCRVNGSAQVSRRFINLLLAQDVQERNYISDIVLGTFTQGVAYTQGRVSFETVPDPQRGTLEVRLEGLTACPENVAQRRRVSVYSSAQTVIRANKQVQISDLGFSLAPAVAFCGTSVQISDVDARSRLVERISWRRANQLVPQAEQAASQRAQAEASFKLDKQANAALGGMNDVFCQKIRAPLVRMGALPEKLRFWTDAAHLRLSLVQHNDSQLSAASQAPLLPSDYDLGGCVHETLIVNLCESLLGGSTARDQAWLDLMNILTGTSPRPLWVHDRAERWSVTLAKKAPLTVEFADDRIRIGLHLASVTRGSRQFQGPAEIEAVFVPKITADGPAFIRDGDLQVRVTAQLDPEAATALQAFLARKFGAVLPPELNLNGLVPPTGGSIGKLRLLELVEFRSSGGWLALGYQLEDRSAADKSDLAIAR